ncbi:protein of unknown function (DUF928) [Rivularia sp. PCC 7116]|uniref:DUF928 domain-containing protein n=1 Tax=Rivularia sp. PCC 7116 TaxID=373994 RepID=UPI00029F3C2C|nr:DUF928 domain-containing protein [Rivularia sp. PCC 7116]AFY58016.1 protein of unknown function (DUF928) [Rivularia sp. PCC 7116]
MLKSQYYQLFKLSFTINLILVISSLPVKAEKIDSSTNRQQNNASQVNRKKPESTRNLNVPRRHQQTFGNSKPRKSFLYFRQPQRQGTPQGTTPAGSRNGCYVAEKTPLSALVPVTKQTDGRVLRWGLTTKANPIFWFYVPYKLSSISNAKFSLRSRQNKTIYEKKIQFTNTPGVIGIPIEADLATLKVGEWYQYYLFMDIDCSYNEKSRKEFARAWVKREAIASGFEQQLKRLSPRQRGLFYAKHGIWYDAMVTFAQMKYLTRKNIEWNQMLELIGLEQISQVPLSNCCQDSPAENKSPS